MTLPIDHLSASSLNKFMKCPRQWQERYILDKKEPSNSSLIIGSAFHLGINRLNQGMEVGDYFTEVVEEAEDTYGEIVWKDSPEFCRNMAAAMLYHYWELIGKYEDVIATEQEFSVEVPGVPVPVIGFIDTETTRVIRDYKTNGSYTTKQAKFFNRSPNPEYRFQMGVYQLVKPKPAEIHMVTRAKEDPVLLPSDLPSLGFGMLDTDKIKTAILDQWNLMNYLYETYGAEHPWPGNVNHEWAGKFCGLGERCCAL